jgi:hypothetical protein
MSVKRLLLVVSLTVIATSLIASAQENQLSGIIGRTFVSDQGIKGANFENPTVHFGNGLTFEANYSRHLLGQGFFQLHGEVPFVFNFDQDLNAGANVIPESYKFFFVTPAARVNLFANTAIQPWFSFGGGFGHFSSSSNLVFGGDNPGDRGSTTGVLEMGFGLDVRFKPRWMVRGGVRDFWSGTPNLNVGGGIVWLFGK